VFRNIDSTGKRPRKRLRFHSQPTIWGCLT
jgi:hypothetical protein